MIKISVIVPVYNMEKYLSKCLDSLLNQTLEEIEIIAVNDGSTDLSASILQTYESKSDKITVISKENGGLSDARNHGFLHAKGDYVAFLDSDDFVDCDMYRVMYEKAKEGDYDIIECNLHHTFVNYEDTEIVEKYYDKKRLLTHGRCIVWNKIYNRKWLIETGVVFPKGIIYEDLDFFSRLVPFISSYEYVDIAPIHYVQRSSSICNAESVRCLHILDVLRNVRLFYIEEGFYNTYEKELEFLYARIILCSSFKRMCRIGSRNERKAALRQNRLELISTFPKWKKNSILKDEKGANALFMKMQNATIYKFCCLITPPLLKVADILCTTKKFE